MTTAARPPASGPRGRPPRKPSGPARMPAIIAATWRLRPDQAATLFGVDDIEPDAVQRCLDDPRQRENIETRVALVTHIRMRLRSMFRDKETENAWLREPHALLDDAVPMTLMLSGSLDDLQRVHDYVLDDCYYS